jgi:hypothetical protein
MRSKWPKDTPYYLTGEVDKAAHPFLDELGLGRVRPDLLVHRPGVMDRNHAIIEVKPASAVLAGLEKDFRVMSGFVRNFGYHRAIYLIFGEDSSDAVPLVMGQACEFPDLVPFDLWVHAAPGAAAERVVEA